MPDYIAQLNQIRQQEQQAAKKTDEKTSSSKSDKQVQVTGAEFLLIGFVAVIADLLGPFGFPCVLILIFWYFMKFNKFPLKKLIGSGAAEILSLGILPGWTGFVVATYLEQKGYFSKIKMIKKFT